MSIEEANKIQKPDLMFQLATVLKNKVIERHSYFQMKYFIVNKEPTTQAKLWQCLREMKSRFEALEALSLELEDGKDNLELINIKIDKLAKKVEIYEENEEVTKRELEIQLKKIIRRKVAAFKNIQQLAEKKISLEEEARFFLEMFRVWSEVESLKSFDDFDAQCQYWQEKLQNKLNLKLMMNSGIDTELIETVLALPDQAPIKQQTIKSLDTRHERGMRLALAEAENDKVSISKANKE